ncbi:unnamed protein product [Urochloa decumbens]|uniref:SMP domain-containing protein n=1 Tax=Urochloa decumbens TaxID=240449 RepID=A0ABC9CZ66_9POAL
MNHGEDLVRARVVPIGEALQAVAQPNKAVTIGEALQAVVRSSAGEKPVDFADAAAIQAIVETCGNDEQGKDLAAAALRAAERNVKPADERSGGEATVRLRDVLGEAKLSGGDKAVTREDAENVAAAARTSAGKRGAGTGKAVVEAVTAAADMNERRAMA